MKQILQNRKTTILVTGPSAETLKQLEKVIFFQKTPIQQQHFLIWIMDWSGLRTKY
jgi:hypothetical protein